MSLLWMGVLAMYIWFTGISIERIGFFVLIPLTTVRAYLFGRRQGIQVSRKFIRKFGATVEQRRQTLLRQALENVFGTEEVAT